VAPLVTLAAWKRLTPALQGYLLYMQGDRSGSELHGQRCPYERGTKEHRAFCEGERQAVLVAQDSEE
jgi:hypothetical protein